MESLNTPPSQGVSSGPKITANSEAAKLYTDDRKEYYRRVKDIVETSWTQ